MLENHAYYRDINIPHNNFYSDKTYLQVNCTGISEYDTELRANTVRRDYYLIYLVSGQVDIYAPFSNQHKLSAGEMIVFRCGSAFEYHNQAGNKMIYYWVHFTGYGAEALLRKSGIEMNTIIRIGHHDSLIMKFNALFKTFTIRDKFSDMDSTNCLSGLLIAIGRRIIGANPGNIQNMNARINNSIEYIHENIGGIIAVKTLAELEYLSVSRYCAIFKSVMNMSPQDYIITLRLNCACEMLRQTDFMICDIAAYVGYDDQRYFSRIFVKRFGITPSNYRKL